MYQHTFACPLGNLLLIPIEQSILYVRPLYVQAQGETQVPELKRVIVAFGDQVVMENTLEEALTEIFGESPETLEDVAVPDSGATDPGDTLEPPPEEETPGELQTVEELLQQATALVGLGQRPDGRPANPCQERHDLLVQAGR